MNKLQTGIAVALAILVVAVFFIFPSLSPFQSVSSTGDTQGTNLQMQQNDGTTTSMDTTENNGQLMATDEVVGTGATAEAGDTVTVQYVGSLTDGTVFDASKNHGDQGFTFTLGAGQVIQGWDIGVAGMKEGGKRKLVIPAALAYGDQAVGNVIPAGSTLVFEVELVKVQKAAQ